MFVRIAAFGLVLGVAAPGMAADTAKPVTFSKDVAPIFQAKCQECHQPNSIAPMSLITFQDVRPWARSGKRSVPGEKIAWDQHIHAVGEEVTAGSEIGIWLYKKGEEPKKRSYLVGFTGIKGGRYLDIPPNSMAQTEGFTVLKENALIENFQPHFHLRGKSMQVEAILPDGSNQILSYVGNFNFNWMTNYIYDDDAAPLLPKGTVVHVSAWYDNTKANKNNPDSDQWVGFGDRTVDEMAHAWMNVVYFNDDEYQALQAERKAKIAKTTNDNEKQQ